MFKKLVSLFLFLLVFSAGYILGFNKVGSTEYEGNLSDTEAVRQADDVSEPNNSTKPWLALDLKYFNRKDLDWGSGSGYGDEKSLAGFSNAALLNIAVYQTYPTTETTISSFSNEHKNLEIKDVSSVNLPEGDVWLKLAHEAVNRWGIFTTHYLPKYIVDGVTMMDIDDDGEEEKIIDYNYSGRADGGSNKVDIIKNNKIIFSVTEDRSSIIPADTNNGFYVEWQPDQGAPRCCTEFYKRTRFVLEDGRFIPIYEQEFGPMKVERPI